MEETHLYICEECGEELVQDFGSGEDALGEFFDMECGNCLHLTRFYIDGED